MKTISDDDLILLYYGEHDDPTLARSVATDPELARRFEALCAELALLENVTAPAREEDYGAQVWQRLVPELQPRPKRSRSWLSMLGEPRFSLAGVLSIALVATLAYWMGRGSIEPDTHPGMNPGLVETSTAPGEVALAGINTRRLLSHRAAGHLDQVDVMLTRFVNSPAEQDQSLAGTAEWATDMLVSNRLYRRAAEAAGDRQLAAVLAELEPLLIELAHQSYQGSDQTRERLQQEVDDGLLFKVRVMNNDLKTTDDPV